MVRWFRGLGRGPQARDAELRPYHDQDASSTRGGPPHPASTANPALGEAAGLWGSATTVAHRTSRIPVTRLIPTTHRRGRVPRPQSPASEGRLTVVPLVTHNENGPAIREG